MKKMGFRADATLLDALFSSSHVGSARFWRNKVVHDLGPSNVGGLISNSATLNKKMQKFLDIYTPASLAYLKTNYSHLLP
jgi:hypothetical protein